MAKHAEFLVFTNTQTALDLPRARLLAPYVLRTAHPWRVPRRLFCRRACALPHGVVDSFCEMNLYTNRQLSDTGTDEPPTQFTQALTTAGWPD